jgi:hypothetical protein
MLAVQHLLAPLLALFVIADVSDASECARWRAAFDRMPTQTIAIDADGRAVRWAVKVARDAEQRATGFPCVTPAEIARTKILFDFGVEIAIRTAFENAVKERSSTTSAFTTAGITSRHGSSCAAEAPRR